LKLNIDDYHSLAFSVDVNKLLVPTPPIYMIDPNTGDVVRDPETGEPVIASGKNDNVGLVHGMFQSFYDAPGYYDSELGEYTGKFKEELKEFTLGVGAEYWYNNIFTVRTGFFHEAKVKGNRRYLTFGAGLHYNVFNIDVSYLVPVNNTATSGSNPLESTLRFSLTFNLDKWGKNTKLESVN
jgi:hypothetical protein